MLILRSNPGHKSLVAHVKFVHSNYEQEMRNAMANSPDGTICKISKDAFLSDKSMKCAIIHSNV
jgi:hypothetical protein